MLPTPQMPQYMMSEEPPSYRTATHYQQPGFHHEGAQFYQSGYNETGIHPTAPYKPL